MTAREKAGIPDATMHWTRHTYASRLLAKKVPLLDVSRLLGHASYDTTVKYYAHLAPNTLAASVAALNETVLAA